MFARRKWRLYSPCNVVPRPRSLRPSLEQGLFTLFVLSECVYDCGASRGSLCVVGKKDTSLGVTLGILRISLSPLLVKCTSVYGCDS